MILKVGFFVLFRGIKTRDHGYDYGPIPDPHIEQSLKLQHINFEKVAFLSF